MERVRFQGCNTHEDYAYDIEVICDEEAKSILLDIMNMIDRHERTTAEVIDQYHITEGILIANLEGDE